MAKAIPCGCAAFTGALEAGFIEAIGDDLWLASLSTPGNVRGLIYGPKITHCPFCGARFAAAVEAPRATRA